MKHCPLAMQGPTARIQRGKALPGTCRSRLDRKVSSSFGPSRPLHRLFFTSKQNTRLHLSSNDVVCGSVCKRPMDTRLFAKSLTQRNMKHSGGVLQLCFSYSDSSGLLV